jgi:hypothetical protein
MNCGCIKHLGCYTGNQDIDFGFQAPCPGDYVFEIWSANGTYTEITVEFDADDQVVLPMTFNENSTTTIKVRTPDCVRDTMPSFYYFTTPDGACSWTVEGIPPIC